MGPRGRRLPHALRDGRRRPVDGRQRQGQGQAAACARRCCSRAEAAANPADHAHADRHGAARPRAAAAQGVRHARPSDYCPMGVDPVVSVGDAAGPRSALPAAATQPAQTLYDKLDATTVVPAGGRFDWHINQSTRPFVGGGSVDRERSPTSRPGRARASTTRRSCASTSRRRTRRARSSQPRRQAARRGLRPRRLPASTPTARSATRSARRPARPATRRSTSRARRRAPTRHRSTDFTAVSDQYTLKEAPYAIDAQVSSGHKEAYTLTCEDGHGKVLETDSLVVDRGQAVDLNLGCGQKADDVQRAAARRRRHSTGSRSPAGAKAPGGRPSSTARRSAPSTRGTTRTKAKARRHAERGPHHRAKAKRGGR